MNASVGARIHLYIQMGNELERTAAGSWFVNLAGYEKQTVGEGMLIIYM